MSLTLAPASPVVTADDLVGFLDQPWVHRIWTYQELMLSTTPVIVCGQTTLPWWRFAMSILFLSSLTRIGTLATSLRSWRTLVVDRHAFQPSAYQHPVWADTVLTDLVQYRQFVGNIATIFNRADISVIIGFLSLLILTIAVTPLSIPFGISRVRYWFLGLLVLGILPLWMLYALSSNLSHAVQRPRQFPTFKPYSKHLPEDLSTRNTLLSALWARECKEHKDFNFGIRSLMQALSSETLPQLDYASPLGDVYRDLTIQLLRLTGSAEILLAAMKSNVAGQPSWTVDWSRRGPLRIHKKWWDSTDGLFYSPAAPALPPDSWRYDPSHPDILQIRAFRHGVVVEVLNLKEVELDAGQSERAKHIHNLEALLQLVRTRSHGGNWARLTEYLCHVHSLEDAAFDFLRTNRHRQAADVLAVLQSTGRYFNLPQSILRCLETVFRDWNWPRIKLLTHADVFRSIVATCNSVATRRLLFVIAQHQLGHNSRAEASPRSSAIYLAKCGSPLDECRPRVDDEIVRIAGLTASSTAVRRTGDRVRFVDAVEDLDFDMGFHESRPHHHRYLTPSRVAPFVDIS